MLRSEIDYMLSKPEGMPVDVGDVGPVVQSQLLLPHMQLLNTPEPLVGQLQLLPLETGISMAAMQVVTEIMADRSKVAIRRIM